MCALESSGDFVQLSEGYDLVMKYHVLKTWSLAGGSTEKWLDRSRGHWFHQHITSLWWFIFTVNLTGFRVNWEMETGPQTAHWQKQFCSGWSQVYQHPSGQLGQDSVGPIPQQKDFSTKAELLSSTQALHWEKGKASLYTQWSVCICHGHFHRALYINSGTPLFRQKENQK